MTSFYNVTLHTAFNYFFCAIREHKVKEEERIILIKYIKKFYQFLTTTFLKERYKIENLKALTFNKKRFHFDNNYYETVAREKEIRIINKKKLLRSVHTELINHTLLLNAIRILNNKETSTNTIHFKINKKKTQISNAPNIVHNQDSEIVVFVISNFNHNIYTIHDMFITNMHHKALLYDKLNAHYTLTPGTYSTTILI